MSHESWRAHRLRANYGQLVACTVTSLPAGHIQATALSRTVVTGCSFELPISSSTKLRAEDHAQNGVFCE